jgi:porin
MRSAILAAVVFASAIAHAGQDTSPPGAPDAASPPDVLGIDVDGLRPWLGNHGVTPALSYVGEVLGNTTGGFRRATIYEGLATFTLDVNLQQFTGWNGFEGLKFHVSALDIHGAGLTQKALGDVGVVSSIDAYDGIRLDTLWLEQSFDHQRFSLRVGVLAVDDEFYQSAAENLFVHANFGWSSILGLNVPLATYPYAELGARLRVQPTDSSYVMLGVYDGNPAPAVFHDPSPDAVPSTDFNKHGTQWALRRDEGAFLIGEVGFHFNDTPDPNAPASPPGNGKTVVPPPRDKFTSLKGGVAYDTDTFSDAYDAALISRGSAAAPARARSRGGDWAVYAQFDRELYRVPGTETQGLTAFLHGTYMPPDRNAYDYCAETGLVYTGLLAKRADDLLGLGFSIIHASAETTAAVHDANRADGTHNAAPDFEAVLEATYNAHLRPGVWLQPELQFLLHPGATSEHGNAFIIGLRTTINF